MWVLRFKNFLKNPSTSSGSLFRNKIFMLDEVVSKNASNWKMKNEIGFVNMFFLDNFF